MGDVGSCFLGYTFAVIPLMFRDPNPAIPYAAGLLVWPFVFDTLSAVLVRLMKGKSVFSGHRSFLFHRMHLAGFPRIRVSLLYHSLGVVGIGLAWVWMSNPDLWDYVGGIAGILCIGLWVLTARIEKAQELSIREGALRPETALSFEAGQSLQAGYRGTQAETVLTSHEVKQP